MFSLQKLFSRDDQFFELLEASAEECRASVQALKRAIANHSRTLTLDEFIGPRRKEKQISAELTELLARVSVTGLEREDIEALSNAFYKIPKTLEKFAQRYILAVGELRDVDFSKNVKLLEQATDITVQMLKELRRGFNMEKISEQNANLQRIEGEADALILDLLRTELYSRKHDPLKVIILKDLYELLEKVVDRCRDAGNVISQIVLKNT
ncbi:MAG: DUF47 family protein [Verrucomicrobiota bacterium]|jgi:hypothetical protein